jgi:predicted carbohydrate-binding protein with CBM5 and CBM33 domain
VIWDIADTGNAFYSCGSVLPLEVLNRLAASWSSETSYR